MKYMAHRDDETGREQTIKEHAEETAKRSAKFAGKFGCEELGYCCGLLHDIGKYSEKFQRRLQGSGEQVDHATAGAQLCQKLSGYYILLSYCIAGHHAGLPDTGENADTGSSKTWIGRMKKKIEPYQVFEQEIKIPEIKIQLSQKMGKNVDFSIGFLIRMLYSCLVDADYLDTENFMKNGQVERNTGDDINVLWEKLQKHTAKWLETTDVDTINGRRTEILKNCMESGREKRGLFRLTVPTGGGKTIASLAFALKHAKEHNLGRIIYVIPYTSIIEQNAQVFRDILGKDNVLEHHCNVDCESKEELKQQQLAAENWDKPVVVTTNVQFFESLFSNRSSRCRKLHNIVNSVIIFDEVQMLPNDYLKPCTSVIEELVRNYGCTAVLCTATQPALQDFFSKDMTIKELCPRVKEQFEFFRRSNVKVIGTLTEEELETKLCEEDQALCILNTKKTVQRVYREVKGDGVYHLSTFMYPEHRKKILQTIRERLQAGKRCVVIATSLVEAGVDLDFKNVYRQLAGVDSVVQAAGRCNREGKRSVDESITYVFQLDNREKVPGQEQQIDTAKQIIRKYEDMTDLAAIWEYFVRLYGYKGETLDKKKIMEMFHKRRYPFETMAKEFKLIEENTKTILIPKEARAKEIAEEIRYRGATKELMREAGQYCVNVYENTFEKLSETAMVEGISEDLKGEMFVLKNMEDYSEKTGLRIDVELGEGIWL